MEPYDDLAFLWKRWWGYPQVLTPMSPWLGDLTKPFHERGSVWVGDLTLPRTVGSERWILGPKRPIVGGGAPGGSFM